MTFPEIHVIKTSDGRDLEFLLEGPSNGFPLIYHSGTPSATVPFPLLSAAAGARGLRLVGHSRPGYGESSARPDSTVAATVDDVTTILEHLGADKFLALGWSGGGPRALACAAMHDRCQAAATIAGVAPFDADGLDWFDAMAPENLEEYAAAAAGQQSLTEFLEQAAAGMTERSAEQVGHSMGELVSEVDKAALTGELADYLAAALRRSCLHGIEGWRDDDLTLMKPWGFELAAITVPVSIWQGSQDQMVPFAHGKWLAGAVPGARAHLVDGEGHISLMRRVGEILDDLLDRAGELDQGHVL